MSINHSCAFRFAIFLSLQQRKTTSGYRCSWSSSSIATACSCATCTAPIILTISMRAYISYFCPIILIFTAASTATADSLQPRNAPKETKKHNKIRLWFFHTKASLSAPSLRLSLALPLVYYQSPAVVTVSESRPRACIASPASVLVLVLVFFLVLLQHGHLVYLAVLVFHRPAVSVSVPSVVSVPRVAQTLFIASLPHKPSHYHTIINRFLLSPQSLPEYRPKSKTSKTAPSTSIRLTSSTAPSCLAL